MYPSLSQNAIANTIFAAILILGCAAMASPVVNSAPTKHDIHNLMSLLGKLKDSNRLRVDSKGSAPSHSLQKARIPAQILLGEDVDSVDSDYDIDSAEDSPASVGKRQGAWSFDYGLGGGRFGKRGGYEYPEYGLGGGRFGRDVDHVASNRKVDNAL